MKHLNDPPCRTCKRPTSVCRSGADRTHVREGGDMREWSIAECAPEPRRLRVTSEEGLVTISSELATSWGDRAERLPGDRSSAILTSTEFRWLAELAPDVVVHINEGEVDFSYDINPDLRVAIVLFAWWLCDTALPWLLRRAKRRAHCDACDDTGWVDTAGIVSTTSKACTKCSRGADVRRYGVAL